MLEPVDPGTGRGSASHAFRAGYSYSIASIIDNLGFLSLRVYH